MAETDISICSRALTQLAARPISSFNEAEGDTAIICGNIYPSLKRGVMSQFPWRFLMRKAALTRDAVAPIGEWEHSYLLPGDALDLAHAVFSDGSTKISTQRFEVFGRRLYSDHEQLIIDYKAEVIESEWPAYFVEAMVAIVAANIALPVTDQQNIAERWFQQAYGLPSDNGQGGQLGQALTTDAHGNTLEGFQTDIFTNARVQGGFGTAGDFF